MKNFSLFLLLFALAPLSSTADADKAQDRPADTIYKVIGADGTITFSDTPPADKKAEKVEIGPINVQPIVLPRTLTTRKLSPAKAKSRKKQLLGSVNFAIVSPADGATIPPGQRLIVLQVAIDPIPPAGYAFFAVVDGQRWGGSSSGTRLDISALERGSHSVQTVLLNRNGQLLARSQIIQLYVKRPGGQLPDFPAERAPRTPQAPRAPGVSGPP